MVFSISCGFGVLLVLNLYRVIDAINKMESLLGSTLTSKGGAVPTASLVSDGKTVALYFSAHWCPPCRGFTPKVRVVRSRLRFYWLMGYIMSGLSPFGGGECRQLQ